MQYFDKESGERVAVKYSVNGEEVSFEEYAKVIEGFYDDNNDNEDEDDIEENTDEIDDVDPQCECCNCDDEDCDDFHCTCGENEGDEQEFSDEDEEIIKLIEKYASIIEEEPLCKCGCELRNILFELFDVGRNIGFGDAKDMIKEFLEN
jgi:hypothetical protein